VVFGLSVWFNLAVGVVAGVALYCMLHVWQTGSALTATAARTNTGDAKVGGCR
jgi:MFS superfamily sulfate permease-like transporter